METTTWKTIAIIFMTLFIVETLLIIWGYYLIINEENMTKECYYDICSEYPEAFIQDDICTCYDYDVMGDFVPVKTEVIK